LPRNGIPGGTIWLPPIIAAGPLAFLDPGGRLRAGRSKERIVGGVIFSANEIVEPELSSTTRPIETCCWSAMR